MRNIDSLKNGEFQRIYKLHDSLACGPVVMYKAEGTGKLGIVCSKKVGNSVVRHRFARLVREIYRKHKDEIKEGTDLIVVARESAKEQGFTEIEDAFVKLLKRHSVYSEKGIEVRV
ncbi:MAG: ribonuclease P protein component [Lachnospiraceae bacterium]|nr:ribonuclease P protein component [Lachnospiraceae bacterium]